MERKSPFKSPLPGHANSYVEKYFPNDGCVYGSQVRLSSSSTAIMKLFNTAKNLYDAGVAANNVYQQIRRDGQGTQQAAQPAGNTSTMAATIPGGSLQLETRTTTDPSGTTVEFKVRLGPCSNHSSLSRSNFSWRR